MGRDGEHISAIGHFHSGMVRDCYYKGQKTYLMDGLAF